MMNRVREHLERHGDFLGRSEMLSHFFTEAARVLIAQDLKEVEWQRRVEGDDVGEEKAQWEDSPDAKSQRRK